MHAIERVVLIVLDSAGVGYLPDAAEYGDLGANTIGNISEAVPLSLPHMEALGLGNIIPLRTIAPTKSPKAAWGKAASMSRGKDTTIGHWEIAGIIKDTPLPTWPEGIPKEVSKAFEERIGRKTLGNTVASGTEIIETWGEEHVATGFPICYTSADSVFQIACHEEVVPLETLYSWCQIARDMLDVGRIIARPFVGKPGNWQRTANRHDYSLAPPAETMLDRLVSANKKVTSIGKISDIFAGRGITTSYPIKSNAHGIETTVERIKNDDAQLIFTNLVDFDMKFGHRRDVVGYQQALEEFDSYLPKILAALQKNDVLIITADHGCDPTFQGSDHTREYIPLLIYGERIIPGSIGVRKSFSDIAASIEGFLLGTQKEGSFALDILK